MKENCPFISVIVPVYNAERYINDCVESLVKSARKCQEAGGGQVEIICVDDGSKDKSSSILDTWAERLCGGSITFKVIHKVNGGVSVARNSGIDAAKGKWIRFVDADDWVDENLDYCIAEVEKNTPDVDFIAFGINRTDCDGNVVKKLWVDAPSGLLSGDEMLGSIKYSKYAGMVWNKAFRSAVINSANLRFLQGVQPGEDDLFSMMFLTYGVKAVVCPQISGYYYRMTPGSAMNTMNVRKSMYLMDVFSVLYARWCVTLGCGLGAQLVVLAKRAICLGACESKAYRRACIEALLESNIFNTEIVPYAKKNGDIKTRIFAVIYAAVPKWVRKILLSLK